MTGSVYRTPREGGIEERLRVCRLLVLDFDGVMTDNKVVVHDDGHESVVCSRADGMGLRYLRTLSDVQVLILSGEMHSAGRARARKLAIDYVCGGDSKLAALTEEIAKRHLDTEAVCYVGNDLNDLECMGAVGVSIAVSDAASEAIAMADYVTRRRGGDGAVREVCELILQAHKAVPQ